MHVKGSDQKVATHLIMLFVAGKVGGRAGRREGARQREDDNALALEEVRSGHVLPRERVITADLPRVFVMVEQAEGVKCKAERLAQTAHEHGSQSKHLLIANASLEDNIWHDVSFLRRVLATAQCHGTLGEHHSILESLHEHFRENLYKTRLATCEPEPSYTAGKAAWPASETDIGAARAAAAELMERAPASVSAVARRRAMSCKSMKFRCLLDRAYGCWRVQGTWYAQYCTVVSSFIFEEQLLHPYFPGKCGGDPRKILY